jgi:transposase
MQAMYTLQHTNLQNARASHLKVAQREVYEVVQHSHSADVVPEGLKRWIGWAMRSRLEPFQAADAHAQDAL